VITIAFASLTYMVLHNFEILIYKIQNIDPKNTSFDIKQKCQKLMPTALSIPRRSPIQVL